MVPESTVENLKQFALALEPGVRISLSGTKFTVFLSGGCETGKIKKLAGRLRSLHRNTRKMKR